MMRSILGLDPGPLESAFALFDGSRVLEHGHIDNEILLQRLIARRFERTDYVPVIEQLEGFGLPIGKDVLETAFWSGRFAQAAAPFERVKRKAIKRHLCGRTNVKDADVRLALMQRFGGGFPTTFNGHKFAALAVACTWWDQHRVTTGDLLTV